MMNSAPTPEIKKLLEEYTKLKAEAEELKESDPEKSEQKKWDAVQISKKIEQKRS